jgi:hypothetical protein
VPALIGAVGTVAAAVVGLFAAQSAGVITVIAGAQPTMTVTAPPSTVTVTLPPSVSPQITAEGVTDGSTEPGQPTVVRLADRDNRPADVVLPGAAFYAEKNVGINGSNFDFAWVRGTGAGGGVQVVAVNLARQYSTFTTRLGLRDTSADNATKVEVVVDGIIVKSGTASLARSYDWTIDVKDALRLEIKAYAPKSGTAYVALGDPTITP